MKLSTRTIAKLAAPRALLDGKPETCAKWATSYVERKVPLAAIKKVYERAPITKELASAINPDSDFAEIWGDARAIGYPKT